MRGRRATAFASCALVVGAALGDGARADGPTPESDLAARVAKGRLESAQALRAVAAWGDRNGLERTSDGDWETAYALDPANEEAMRRLRFARRGGAWVRDEPSAILARLAPDGRPDRAAEYATKRLVEAIRPAARRERALARWCFSVRLVGAGEAALRRAVALDPDDPWARLGLGEVSDAYDGWVPAEVAARRTADGSAEDGIRRLAALRAQAVRQAGEGPAAGALGFATTAWRLREWTLETDLDDDAAALALASVDLGARWFRDAFGIPAAEAVLPHGGSFLVLSTNDRYRRALEIETRLSVGQRRFAQRLGAMPVGHTGSDEPWHVILERPSGDTAADGCLHLAVHLLFEARFRLAARDAALYEGLAAYAVLRVAGTNDTWCVELEATTTAPGPLSEPDATRWAEVALETVARRDDFPLRALLGASLNGLDGGMVVKSWSFARWLLEEHAADARLFLAEKARGAPTDAALERATGLRVEDVDALWRRHVLATEGE